VRGVKLLRFYSSLSLSLILSCLRDSLSLFVLLFARLHQSTTTRERVSSCRFLRARARSLSPSPSLCLCVCVLCGVLVCCLHARVQVDLWTLCVQYRPTYLPTYLPTCLMKEALCPVPTYLPTYLPTCLMKGALCPVPTYLVKWAFVTRT
jgi:hypothetical protein